jgi:hypothetical protein
LVVVMWSGTVLVWYGSGLVWSGLAPLASESASASASASASSSSSFSLLRCAETLDSSSSFMLAKRAQSGEEDWWLSCSAVSRTCCAQHQHPTHETRQHRAEPPRCAAPNRTGQPPLRHAKPRPAHHPRRIFPTSDAQPRTAQRSMFQQQVEIVHVLNLRMTHLGVRI